MDLNVRIKAFARLGEVIRNGLTGKDPGNYATLNSVIESQQVKNQWFTPENVRMSLEAIAEQLTSENLYYWTGKYPTLIQKSRPLTIAVVMAGNIPLVGFHDFLSVLISGNRIIAKTSSKDADLIKFITGLLTGIEPLFRDRISFTEGTLPAFDGIIATGSNNSSRYFEYYFGRHPNIIRKNRNSIAIIEGDETDEELQGLGKDIFSYFGLGCRNISKIFVPRNYDFQLMIRNLEAYSYIVNHSKYANNYDFNKAIYLVNREPFLDTGYLLLREETKLASPVAVVYYEYYDSYEQINEIIVNMSDKIQCISGKKNISPGRAQMPNLWDYADGIDTIEFMLKKFSDGIIVK